MNDVLWLLYAADLVSGLTGAGWLFGIVFAAATFACAHAASEAKTDEEHLSDVRAAKKFAAATVAAILFTSALPTTTTVYAAAALSAGNQVGQTEIGKKALAALENWLDKQTDKKGN